MQLGQVFITGGTGTLGRALLQRIASDNELRGRIAGVTVFSRDEMKQQSVKRDYPFVRLALGDVADYDVLERAMCGHDTVLHLAAFKHIPAGERDVAAMLRSNLTGSQNVARAAMRTGANQVLGISTDKVCHPVNAYGASKLLMERTFQEANRAEITRFHLVRYGNVLSSTGSVIPLWQSQAARGEPLGVTDPGMTRFWLNAAMAVDLVLAALETEPATVLVPRLSGLRMDRMAEYLFPGHPQTVIGLRPGEKLHEELLTVEESRFVHIRDNRFVLYPVTGEPCAAAPRSYGYTSDRADELTRAELYRLLGMEHAPA